MGTLCWHPAQDEPRSPETHLDHDEEEVGRKTEGSKEGLSRRVWPRSSIE